jgi:hypothetical protein
MALPRSLPVYVASPKTAFRNSIQIHGIDSECLGGMIIDNSYYLEGEEASSYFYIIPAAPHSPVAYSYGSFVADCLAFEHAFPMQAMPPGRSLPLRKVPWGLKPRQRRDIPEMYLDRVIESYELAAGLAEGPWFHPAFRYDLPNVTTVTHKGFELIVLDFSRRYARVPQALHLYNAALRQTDPLAQYLNFYRIIEHLTGSNGKSWIQNTIQNLPDYATDIYITFGVPDRPKTSLKQCLDPSARKHVRTSRARGPGGLRNFAEVLRAYCLERLNQLAVNHTPADVARRFYNTNRCGIAHGTNIRRHDLDVDFQDIISDLRALKYLARIAIEHHI